MESLRTTAPRTPTAPPAIWKYDEKVQQRPMEDDWNLVRDRGLQPWMQGQTALPDRLAKLDASADDVSVVWRTDPAGRDTSIEIPVISMGSSDAKAPTMLVVAGQHGREPGSVAATLDWTEGLVNARAAGDPQAEWLLASRRIVVVPVANPRGFAGAMHELTNAGRGAPAASADFDLFPDGVTDPTPFQSYLWMRKNQNGEHGRGADLNRNHAQTFQGWPEDAIANDPIGIARHSYPGKAAASEPETRIVDGLLDELRPSVVVDLHQSGNFVNTVVRSDADKAPTVAALQRLHAETGLDVEPAAKVPRVDEAAAMGLAGALDGEGAARGAQLSLTIELGRSFVTSQEDYPEVRDTAARALTLLARGADAPLDRLRGPDVASAATAAPIGGWRVDVSDARSGSANIAAVELVRDPLAAPGTGTALAAADGAFDQPFEAVHMDAAAFDGAGPIGVRARDTEGHWGAVTPLRLDNAAGDAN